MFVSASTPVPVVTLVLSDPSEQDEEIRKIQASVVTGMAANVSHLQAYLKTWDKYRDIWEINKDSFILRYQRLNPSVTSFDADINRHCAIIFKHPSLPEVSINLKLLFAEKELKQLLSGMN